MKNYRYDIISADLDFGIKKHPQQQMKELGFEVLKSEPVPIGDCWWFRVEDSQIDIPEYLTPMSDDFRFSDEADKPRVIHHHVIVPNFGGSSCLL